MIHFFLKHDFWVEDLWFKIHLPGEDGAEPKGQSQRLFALYYSCEPSLLLKVRIMTLMLGWLMVLDFVDFCSTNFCESSAALLVSDLGFGR